MASDVQRWFDSEARQTEAIARAERDALAAEVSALRAALEAAEARAVPEGWKVEWRPGRCGWCSTRHTHDPVPRLVPLSPTDTPEVSP